MDARLVLGFTPNLNVKITKDDIEKRYLIIQKFLTHASIDNISKKYLGLVEKAKNFLTKNNPHFNRATYYS